MKCPSCHAHLDLTDPAVLSDEEFKSVRGARHFAKRSVNTGGAYWGHHVEGYSRCKCEACTLARSERVLQPRTPKPLLPAAPIPPKRIAARVEKIAADRLGKFQKIEKRERKQAALKQSLEMLEAKRALREAKALVKLKAAEKEVMMASRKTAKRGRPVGSKKKPKEKA